MNGFHANITHLTATNGNFRQVIYTGKNTQLVLMSIEPAGEISAEIHPENDQFFHFESGEGLVIIDSNEYDVSAGSAIIVPAGAEHTVINVSDTDPLQLYTLYSPPHHKDGATHATIEDAIADDEDFDGTTTE